jgi:O-acetyl-ADP-ribose deacetylase (regulator of RNase III)
LSNVVAEQPLPNGTVLRLVHGDLTEESVDAIVNAANAQLNHGGGVAGAIVRRGGRSIQTESDEWVLRHGAVDHDHPALTSAGQLPCRHVIHTVGPVWGEGDEDAKLATAVTSSLALAAHQGYVSLALPAISTGIFGFPKARGARVMLDAIVAFFSADPSSSLHQVRVTLIDEPTVRVFEGEFRRRWPAGEPSQ